MRKIMTVALMGGALLAGACSNEATAPATDELALAQQVEAIAANVAATTQTRHEDWVRRLFAALRNTDNPAAQECLAEARELRRQAVAAFEAGDRELGRQLLRESFLRVLCAVVEVFPNAAVRTGEAVDNAIARIEERLGDRDAPRIRAILAHVRELREQADAALAEGNAVEALALNVRAIQILHRMVAHFRGVHRDHNEVADSEMQAVGI